MPNISISKGNIKMGQIPSVSLPPVKTCSPDACKTCAKQKCYALKIYKLRKTVRDAYNRNLKILKEDPEQFWREVEAAIMTTTVFRFSVSGDIYDKDYLKHMVKLAEKYPHCEMLAFTKKFDLCNEWLATHSFCFPRNLHIIYSAWRGLEMNNPFDMPECHVIFKDGTMTAKKQKVSYYCGGNCMECYCSPNHRGCLSLRKGEQILIKEH